MKKIFHNVEIICPNDDAPIPTIVKVDGENVRCRRYKLEQSIETIPVLELDLVAIPSVEHNQVTVKVSNKREIAACMDYQEFKEFCDVWNHLHDGTECMVAEQQITEKEMEEILNENRS